MFQILNGHVGTNPGVFQRVHGGKFYGQRNREGAKILESMESLDLALVNTFFNKNEEHLITYKSGWNSSQIGFIMTRRADLKEMRDCKVIPGEEVVSQHRLLCAVLRTKEAKHRRRTREKRFKIWTLKGEKVTEYRDKVEEEYQLEADTNAEESWKLFKKVVMRAAEEICGTTKGGKHLERETLWWNEEVQESMRRKKDAFKKWQMQGGNELKEAYKTTKREAKAAVAKAKHEAYKEWYDKMGTEGGERMIYRVAKQRAMSRKDTGEVNVIKYQIGEMLADEVKIKERWRKYFSNLLNVENAREQHGEVPTVEGPVQEL